MRAPLTRPERSAEWRNIKRIRAAILRCGGCGCCFNRASSFGERGYCKTEHRTFPLCMKTPGLSFVLDEAALDRIERKRAA
jgi:hypothetical protein